MTTGVGANDAAPFNSFSHGRTLAGADDTFVSINNDTVYSIAQVDLSVGPVLLHVPDIGRALLRAAVRRRVDEQLRLRRQARHRHGCAATSCCSRPAGRARRIRGATGSGSRPDRHDRRAVGVRRRRRPARRARAAGRDDAHPVGRSPCRPTGLPDLADGLGEALSFCEKLRLWSRAFPPAPRDEQLQASFAPLGLTGEALAYVDADDEPRPCSRRARRRAAALDSCSTRAAAR